MSEPVIIDFDRESVLEEMVEQLFKKYMEKYDVFRDDILVFITVISYPREYIVEIYDSFSTKVKYYTTKDISDALMWAEELLPWWTVGSTQSVRDEVTVAECLLEQQSSIAAAAFPAESGGQIPVDGGSKRSTAK